MNLVDVLIYQMEKLSIIEKEDSQLYRYGMQNAIVIGINLLTAIVISIILHKLEIVVIFLCMFSLVRVFAGGYHTRRKIYCYLFSNLCLIIPMYGNGLYCLLEPELPVTLIPYTYFGFKDKINIVLPGNVCLTYAEDGHILTVKEFETQITKKRVY